ncbi:MAG: FtsW/RodA/SpoVE family cell cycle protein [Tumebacillaceae bacterium]
MDVSLIAITVAICLASFVAISSATHSEAGGSQSYVIKQAFWVVIGICAMAFLIRVEYRLLIRYVEVAYWVVVVMLGSVFLFKGSVQTHGAYGWIPMPGGFALQPSEFFKVVFVLMMAKYLANEQEDEDGNLPDQKRGYAILIVCSALAIGLIVIEPDLGQTMMLMSVVAAAMFVHLPPRLFWLLFIGGIGSICGFWLLCFVYNQQFLHLLELLNQRGILEEHQLWRFKTFIHPEADLNNEGYQVFQAKVAIGSGKLFGKGLYHGSQTQGSWVPEQHTDFIFSVIAEELGFVGCVAVIFLFFLMLYRIMANGQRAYDRTGMYICTMVAGMFTFQIFENIGMSLQLMPMTGVTLPFISYGGSSILTNFMLIGIVLNVGLRRRKLSFIS